MNRMNRMAQLNIKLKAYRDREVQFGVQTPPNH